MSRLARSSISLGDPPAPNAAAVIWKKIGGLVASPAVTSMPRVVCRFDAESDEAARMEPSSEMPNFCSTQRPVPCPSLTTTASSATLKSSGTTAFQASMLIFPEQRRERIKGNKERGKGKHPYHEDATKGEASTVAAPKPRSKANEAARGLPIESLNISIFNLCSPLETGCKIEK